MTSNIRFALRVTSAIGETFSGEYYVVDTETDTVITDVTDDNAFAVRQRDWLNETYAPGIPVVSLVANALCDGAVREAMLAELDSTTPSPDRPTDW